ncbi:MAG TPA: hypothetical protein VK638_16855 [Edaphobacter sp.]|nr:hypothetical protein [Edaphobacter sp.]
MKWKTVAIVGAVLFVAGFLLGFIPEYRRASKLAMQLESVRLESKLREIRELASLSYIDATKMNYGSAAGDSERMFGVAREVANDTKDDGLRNTLTGLLTFHDTIKGKLSVGDASVLEPLQQIVQTTQRELKR